MDEKLTVGQWLDFWLNEKTKIDGVSAAGKSVRATTGRSYRQHVQSYLQPTLGALSLDKLTGEDIAAAYDTILRDAQARSSSGSRALSPATLRRIHATLSSALNRAVKTRRIAYNPAQQVDLPD